MPLAIAFGKLTQGHIYTGDFSAAFVMPLVTNLPKAIVAAAAGAVLAWLVESERPVVSWAIFPALLYGVLGFSRVPLGAASSSCGPGNADSWRTVSRARMCCRCTGGGTAASNLRLQAISDKS